MRHSHWFQRVQLTISKPFGQDKVVWQNEVWQCACGQKARINFNRQFFDQDTLKAMFESYSPPSWGGYKQSRKA